MNKDKSERCKLVLGDNSSPGPSKYTPSEASLKLKNSPWLAHPKQTFAHSKRTLNALRSNQNFLTYETPLPKPRKLTVPKAERKSYFPVDSRIAEVPGPGRYPQKRVFDNKMVVDYSKR